MGLLCTMLFALLFSLTVCFAGYRFLMALLPLWGFLFGFLFGVETLTALLGTGFLASAASLIAGFVGGFIFAALAYLFYIVGVAILAGSLGYTLGVGLLGLLGLDFGLLSWIVGIALAIAAIALTFYLRIAKYVIIVVTALGGAALVVSTLALGPAGFEAARVFENPVGLVLNNSPWWTLVYLALAGAGIVVQVLGARRFEPEPYESRLQRPG